MTTKLCKDFNVQKYLLAEETDFNAFFKTCIEEDPGNGSLVRRALAEIAQARCLIELAQRAGLSRQCVCKALFSNSQPSFETISKIARALCLTAPVPRA